MALSFWQLSPGKESSAPRDQHTPQGLDPKVGMTHSAPSEPLKHSLRGQGKKSLPSQLAWAEHRQFWLPLGQRYGGLCSSASVLPQHYRKNLGLEISQTQDRARTPRRSGWLAGWKDVHSHPALGMPWGPRGSRDSGQRREGGGVE